MAEAPAVSPSDVMYCSVHTSVETTLRCNKCGRPMCVKCARRTPVGYRCRECVSNQQQIFFNSGPLDPVIQGVVSVVLSAIAASIIGLILGGLLGFFIFIIGIPASSAAGAGIADLAHRAVGKRRSKYSWLIVAAGVVIGALLAAAVPALFAIGGLGVEGGLTVSFFSIFTNLGWWIYLFAATAAAIGTLRLWR